MSASVYILRSLSSNRYYVGSTSNLSRRLKQHKQGQTATTKRMGKCELVFSQEYPTLEISRRVEKKIKSWKRRDFIEKIIKDKILTQA